MNTPDVLPVPARLKRLKVNALSAVTLVWTQGGVENRREGNR